MVSTDSGKFRWTPLRNYAQRGFYFSDSARSATLLILCSLLAQAGPGRADCQQQLQLLAADLKDVSLTEMQKQDLAGLVDDARRYCWVHRENPAMEYIAKARRVAGIRSPPGEFDWETVPLESLERR